MSTSGHLRWSLLTAGAGRVGKDGTFLKQYFLMSIIFSISTG